MYNFSGHPVDLTSCTVSKAASVEISIRRISVGQQGWFQLSVVLIIINGDVECTNAGLY